jgi:hypothetical protein
MDYFLRLKNTSDNLLLTADVSWASAYDSDMLINPKANIAPLRETLWI